MKKRTRYSIVGICLIFMMIGFSSALTPRSTHQYQYELIFSQSEEASAYLPAESLLEPYSEEFMIKGAVNEESYSVVEYNVLTGAESRYTADPDEIDTGITQLEPYYGDLHNHVNDQTDIFDSPQASGIFPPDDRIRVNDTTLYPYSSVVKIQAQAPNGSWYVGSGAIIDSNHVLTCGHIVYFHDAGPGWATSMTVIPGKNGTGTTLDKEPYGRANAINMRSTDGWINDSSYQHDWALITLDRDIGNNTGWMGMKSLASSHINFTSANNLFTAGYPAEIMSPGTYMYNTTDTGDGADDYNVYYWLDSEGGQSGSAVWTYQNNTPYIVAIHAYSRGGILSNFGTRLNTVKFNLLLSWLATDAASELLPDLITHSSNNIFQALNYQNTVYKLLTPIPIATYVENIGTQSVDMATLGFYLSIDENITTDDYLIGTITIFNIGLIHPVEVQYVARVPLRVPDGTYEIGWIIDPDNQIEELVDDSNSYLQGINLNIESTILDVLLTNPLYLSLIIGGLALIIIVPIVISVARKRKRKRLAMGMG